MKKGALKKTIFREILQSKARFFSIFGIILLGVGFYAGIKATGPDMLNTANQYFSEQKLMDLKITSTMGLTSEDVQLVKKDSRIMDYSAEYSKDINNSETNQVIHFVSYNLKQKPTINSYRVIRGRLPEKSGELAIDSAAMESHSYQIGDTFSINEEEREGLKKYEYTIVGEVVSPQYIELFSRGTTNVGKGSIDFFAVITEEDFDMNVYTELYLRFKDTQSLKAFSKAYDQSVTDNQKRVEKNFKARPKERLTEIKAEGQKKIDSGKQEIQENEKKLTDGEQKLQLAKRSLEDGKVTYSQSVLAFQNEMTANEQKLQDSQQQIAETEQEIENQKDYLENERQKLEQGRQQLFIGEQELAQKNLEWQSQKKTNLEEITNLQQIVVASQELAGSIQGAPQLSDNELLANLSVWETGITRLSEVPEISSQLPVFNEIINQVKVDLSLKNNLLEISAALSQIAVGYQRVLEDSQVQVNQIDQQLAQKQVELEQAAAQINVGEAELQEGYLDSTLAFH